VAMYLDECSFVVRFVDSAAADEDPDDRIFVAWAPEEMPLEDAFESADRVAWNPATQTYEPHVLKQSYSRFNWGASGAGVQFVLDIASNVSSDVIVAGLAYMVGRFSNRAESPQPQVTWSLRDADRYEHEAREAIWRSFELPDPESIALIEAAWVDGFAVLRFEGPAHQEFRATVGHLDDETPYVRISRVR